MTLRALTLLLAALVWTSCADDESPEGAGTSDTGGAKDTADGAGTSDAAPDAGGDTAGADSGATGDGGGVTDTGGADAGGSDATGNDAGPDDAGTPDAGPSWPADAPFPAGFLFGTAVAGFQVDMGCPTLPAATCDDPNSDWYEFVMSPDMVADPSTHLSGDPVSKGPGMWELYDGDFQRAAEELGSSALRMSFEWSRVFPTATDGVEGYEALKAIASADALATYHAMLAALKVRGLKPLITLNHYTLPSWIHDAVGCHKDLDGCSPRGWLDKERTIAEIAKYAGFVAQEFGAEVDLWATENEPLAVVLPGYLMPSAERTNPPAVSLRGKEAREVAVALIEAHARMYDAVKAADTVDADGDGQASRVGLVYATAPVRAKDPGNPLDVQAAKDTEYLWNWLFLDGVCAGVLDDDADGTGEPREDLANRMDFLGINYYTRVTVEGTGVSALPDFSPLLTLNPFTLVPWEYYPRGIYEMAMAVTERYALPIIVTENGTADPSDDGTQVEFLAQMLTWLSRAIHDGAKVEGYFYWTLLDNYEWNHGMGIRMGLFAVDPDDPVKARVARKGVATFKAIATAGEVPQELLDAYPVE
ncbi:MAG: beta-glucosidase [Myxococcales bacterium]